MSLQTFNLTELAQFSVEKQFAPDASKDFVQLYAGRDNVHEALKYILSRITISLHLSMFGFADQELADMVFDIAHNPQIATFITLDSSQAAGVHESKILASEAAKDPQAYNAHIIIGQSATHQINHTKGFVADGIVGATGSTNWSASGEGIFVPGGSGAAGGANFKAQNNTQAFFTGARELSHYSAQLALEHVAAQRKAKT